MAIALLYENGYIRTNDIPLFQSLHGLPGPYCAFFQAKLQKWLPGWAYGSATASSSPLLNGRDFVRF